MPEAGNVHEGSPGPEDGVAQVAAGDGTQPNRPGGHRVATSAYRGVCWHRKSRRWQSAINSSGRHVYLGSFDTEEEAARMFDKVAIRVRGSKAKLNFPYDDYVGPNGELVTDPKLEQLVSEARKALVEKQRWLEAQDEAGTGSKRRRLGAGGAGMDCHLGSPSFTPIGFGMGFVPGPELGLGLGLVHAASVNGSTSLGLGAETGSSGLRGLTTTAALLLTRVQQLERQLSREQTSLLLQGALRNGGDGGLGPASVLNGFGTNSSLASGGLAALLSRPSGGGSAAGTVGVDAAMLQPLLPAAGLAGPLQDAANAVGSSRYAASSVETDTPAMPLPSPAARAGPGRGLTWGTSQLLCLSQEIGNAPASGSQPWLPESIPPSDGSAQRSHSFEDLGASLLHGGPAPHAPSGLPSLIGRFLTNVRQHLPPDVVLESLVPCTDTSLLGYTYVGLSAGAGAQPEVPAACGKRETGPGGCIGRRVPVGYVDSGADADGTDGAGARPRRRSGSSDGSISADYDGASAATQPKAAGAGAGVYFRGAYRDLGLYTTAADSLQACQACMTMLLNFTELLAAEAAEAATAAAAPPVQSMRAAQAARWEAEAEAVAAAAEVRSAMQIPPGELNKALGRGARAAGGILPHLPPQQQCISLQLQQRRPHQEFEVQHQSDSDQPQRKQQHMPLKCEPQLSDMEHDDDGSGAGDGGLHPFWPMQTQARVVPRQAQRCLRKHEEQPQEIHKSRAQQDQQLVHVSPQALEMLTKLLASSSQHGQGLQASLYNALQEPPHGPGQRGRLPLLGSRDSPTPTSLQPLMAQQGEDGGLASQHPVSLAFGGRATRLPTGSSDSTIDTTGNMGPPQQLPQDPGVRRCGKALDAVSAHGVCFAQQGGRQGKGRAGGRRKEDVAFAAAAEESGQSMPSAGMGYVDAGSGQEQGVFRTKLPSSSGQPRISIR